MSVEDEPIQVCIWCYFWKILGIVVRLKGKEIDQSKSKSIQEMPKPKNLKELCGLQGRLAYIRRFISNLASRCHSFGRLLKKGAPFEWDELYRKMFEKTKEYLSKPPVFGASILGKPLKYFTLQLKNSHLEHYVFKRMKKEKKWLCTT